MTELPDQNPGLSGGGPAESFRPFPKASKRTESHTLTVREATRLFEAAGVPRTERSIINWCHPNKQGVARLDCYLDPNEGKYFITPHSVELAIREELAKASKAGSDGPVGHDESSIPKTSESGAPAVRNDANENDPEQAKHLKQEIFDLKITNRGKDYFIEQLQKEREGFALERKQYVEQLMTFNRQVGELSAKLLQLGGGPTADPNAPTSDSQGEIKNAGDNFESKQQRNLDRCLHHFAQRSCRDVTE